MTDAQPIPGVPADRPGVPRETEEEMFTVSLAIENLGAVLNPLAQGGFHDFAVSHSPGMEVIEVVFTFFPNALTVA